MNIRNHHRRQLASSRHCAGQILDTLSSVEDRLWPMEIWPKMKLTKPLEIGSKGGHGPIRYRVVAYEPGVRIRFEFTNPKNFIGYHEFQIFENGPQSCVIEHKVEMIAVGAGWINWKLAVEPMHDALIEDAFDKIAIALGQKPHLNSWSIRVKFFRKALEFMRKRQVSRQM